MVDVCVVVPVSVDVPVGVVRDCVGLLGCQSVGVDVVVSVWGLGFGGVVGARVVGQEGVGRFSLSRTRNVGARVCGSRWLVFCDVDMVYDVDLFERMVGVGARVVAGRSRCDVGLDGVCGGFYRCGFAPLLIDRVLFEEVGGYNVEYCGWGYEDSSLEHKVGGVVDFDSRGRHLLGVHDVVSSSVGWGRGGDGNRGLFLREQGLSLGERVRRDRDNYFR